MDLPRSRPLYQRDPRCATVQHITHFCVHTFVHQSIVLKCTKVGSLYASLPNRSCNRQCVSLYTRVSNRGVKVILYLRYLPLTSVCILRTYTSRFLCVLLLFYMPMQYTSSTLPRLRLNDVSDARRL